MMYKYMIRFSKDGYIRYCSHLDMMRLFQRSFKRAGVALAYSQGFHPHPKMSIAQPLSLGFVSDAEYIEIAASRMLDEKITKENLNKVLPTGIEILLVKRFEDGQGSLASLVEFGGYVISFAVNGKGGDDTDIRTLRDMASRFMDQESITAKKIQKKTGKETVFDLKPYVYEDRFIIDEMGLDGENSIYYDVVDSKFYSLSTVVKTGSAANLNPSLLFDTFLSFSGIRPVEGSVLIRRTGLYGSRGGVLFLPEEL